MLRHKQVLQDNMPQFCTQMHVVCSVQASQEVTWTAVSGHAVDTSAMQQLFTPYMLSAVMHSMPATSGLQQEWYMVTRLILFLSVSSGAVYTDPGATAYDNIDGNLTRSLSSFGIGSVSTSTPTGAMYFTITYSVQVGKYSMIDCCYDLPSSTRLVVCATTYHGCYRPVTPVSLADHTLASCTGCCTQVCDDLLYCRQACPLALCLPALHAYLLQHVCLSCSQVYSIIIAPYKTHCLC